MSNREEAQQLCSRISDTSSDEVLFYKKNNDGNVSILRCDSKKSKMPVSYQEVKPYRVGQYRLVDVLTECNVNSISLYRKYQSTKLYDCLSRQEIISKYKPLVEKNNKLYVKKKVNLKT